MEDKIKEIEQRLNKATPGPWQWDVNIACKTAHLETTHSGMYFVLGFQRWGMQSAQPEFQKFKNYEGPVEERGSLGTYPIKEFAVPRMAHHPDFDMDINHPDAQLIAHAPEDIKYLLGEIKRLNDVVNDLKSHAEYMNYKIEKSGI